MRVVRELLLPLILFIAGGGVVFWWDRFHPTAAVYYTVEASTIPSVPGLAFDTYTRVTLANPSRRTRASNIRVEISIPTGDEVRLGEVETAEGRGTYDVGTSPVGGHVAGGGRLVSVSVERLAPQSSIAIPIWWRSTRGTQVAVKGSCDQCVIVHRSDADSRSSSDLLLSGTSLAVGIAAITMVFISYVYDAAARRARRLYDAQRK